MTEELSPTEAARRIGTTTRSVQRWIAAGRLPARRVGGRWRVASVALDAFLAQAAVPAPTAGPAVAAAIPALFIANRGEIARRIARTCERLGVRGLVPGQAGLPAVDLLDAVAVVSAARAAGAAAVHPGYGFLSEQTSFAEAVLGAGLRWVGPSPEAMRAMGDKASARRLAASVDVPVLPGYDDADQSEDALARAAERIGFPLLVKPSAGGGGKGMRVVRSLDELPAALAAGRREATTAFGDDRLVLERLLEGPRHVEVQVLFDEHGSGVHLGERDCSIQRRHQKVLEETPCPAVDEATRRALGEAALRLAASVGYASAGTCEFLLADDGSFWFLEMNTRLQVEHPVTEAVTGRDLVADQLAIAAGATLESIGLTQEAVDEARSRGGHAIEVRLYAEDSEAGFLPATGPVVELRWPSGRGIRVDAGIDEGAVVTDRFDPMLAKIVAHGTDRSEALARLAAALDSTSVLGLVTNLRFLRWLVRDDAVVRGEARIDTLASRWPPGPLAASPGIGIPDAAWSAAAALLASVVQSHDPWAGGWRLNAPPRLRLAAEGQERTVEVRGETATANEPESARRDPMPAAVVAGDTVHVDVGGRSIGFRLAPPPDVDRAAREARPARGTGPSTVVAPMPGSVVAVHVRPGMPLAAGDPVATLAAMKMEHAIAASSAGTVSEVLVRIGQQVARDEPIAVIDGSV
ncbi:MAG TPA: biotin carboxylase N-terminal domain-containing protein [Candidatus Dormibacteraeota bacterium]|nr:biotin carboxylase N-terminal domain-containing protein [Candidatus Dormibacteraeota bacterium]